MLKPYISYSQLAKFEMSPEKYVEEYIYDKKPVLTQNMAYGSKLADGLMIEEANGDPLLDLMASKLPKFELMDKPIVAKNGIEVDFERHAKRTKLRIPALFDKSGDIPLLAIPDSAKSDYSAFKEYKTSLRRWTQKMVDESGQITFYATAIWIATGKIPADIELVNIQTEYDSDGSLTVTGKMFRFPTKRTLPDIIKMTKRIRSAWKGIGELINKTIF